MGEKSFAPHRGQVSMKATGRRLNLPLSSSNTHHLTLNSHLSPLNFQLSTQNSTSSPPLIIVVRVTAARKRSEGEESALDLRE